jgi:hypothetical protein
VLSAFLEFGPGGDRELAFGFVGLVAAAAILREERGDVFGVVGRGIGGEGGRCADDDQGWMTRAGRSRVRKDLWRAFIDSTPHERQGSEWPA